MRAARIAAACSAVLALLIGATAAHAAQIFGFNDDWAWNTVKRTVAISRSFRANSERVEVYWNSIEPKRGRFNWGTLDLDYQLMLKSHMRPLFDVVAVPNWAKARSCRPFYKCTQTPSHDHDYRVFLAALTKRYPHAIGIEIGQEPNLTNWSVHPDPRRYAQIVKAAWTAIKHANPHMRVILGSTCCTYAFSHGNVGAGVFLADLYRYGIKGHYNAIGFHVYPGRAISLVPADISSELATMRAIRNAHGDHSPFWITETGFPSHGVSHYGGGVFNQRNQAQREVLAYRTLSAMRDVAAIYIYRLTDPKHPTTYASFEQGMGLYTSSYRPKASAGALIRARRGR